MNIKTITSSQNPFIKHLLKLISSKKYRNECQSILVEGSDVIFEIQKYAVIKTLITVDKKFIPNTFSSINTYVVKENIIKKISATKSPPKLLAEIEMPKFQSLENMQWIVALDAVQDPGNLGTLIRTALAFGWQGVFFLTGCCDPWNDKVIRSAKGALFKLPMQQGSFEELKELNKKNLTPIYAADLTGESINELDRKEGAILVLGSEGQGLCREVKAFCKKVTLPMSGDMESLNVSVAGGILMYALKLRA